MNLTSDHGMRKMVVGITRIEGLYYTEYHSVCPLVRFGSVHHLSSKLVCTTPGTKGGQRSPAGEGVGGPNSDDWRESLALCLRCRRDYTL